jgi:rubrerythrin
MSLLQRLSPSRRRYARVWSDPARKRATLELFARTEAEGARDVSAAVARTSDPWLRTHLERHAGDEERHAEMFRRRAAELAESDLSRAPSAAQVDPAFDLEAGRDDLDAHGFLRAAGIDELGDVAYLAMLHVAEKRAASLFALHRDLLRGDPATREVFVSILRDEAYHVAYTGQALKRWREAGRSREVKAGLDAAKGARWMDALRRLGARSGTSFGRTVLLVLQVTVLLPGAWLARRSRPDGRWRPAAKGTPDVGTQG